MYAETQREKLALLEAVRSSDWNAEMNPIVVTLQEGSTVYHDFTTGYVSCLTALMGWVSDLLIAPSWLQSPSLFEIIH
jgi:hypothetical protein